MAKKKIKKEETKEEVVKEEVVVDVKPSKPGFHKIADSNRLRLYLLDKGSLEGAELSEVVIEGFSFRTMNLKGAKITDCIFKDCNFQGANWSEAIDVKGNVFDNCELQYGLKPGGFEGENQFLNGTRLK